MSDITPDNMPVTTPEQAAQQNRRKRIAMIAMGVAGAVGIVLLLLLLFGNNTENTQDSGVVIRIDHEARQAHFTMAAQPGGEEAKDGVLVGTPLGNTALSTAKEVREYYDSMTASKGWNGGFYGSNNFSDEKRGSLAIFYTFYLSNSSTSEEQTFRLQGKLNQSIESLNQGKGARAYEYLRLALYMGNVGQPDDTVKYYGLANSDNVPTEVAPDDMRECIYTFNTLLDEEDGHKYRSPRGEWQDGDIEYVDLFEVGYERNGLFDLGDQKIPVGGTRRVTFVAFLDGNDPDSFKETSSGQFLSFSLHIGV